MNNIVVLLLVFVTSEIRVDVDMRSALVHHNKFHG